MLLDANLTPSLIANLSPNQIMEIAHDKRGTHSLQALIHVCQEEDPFEVRSFGTGFERVVVSLFVRDLPEIRSRGSTVLRRFRRNLSKK